MIFCSNIIIIIGILMVSVSADKNCSCGQAPLAKTDSYKQEHIRIENHPWMVRVGAYGPERERNFCDGYVISPRHILTRTECGCRQNFEHLLFYGSGVFKSVHLGVMPGGEFMDLKNIKCLDTEGYTIFELPESLPLSSKLQPICVAKSSVYDKDEFETYQISWNMFFVNLDIMYDEDRIYQWKVDPKGVKFEPEKHRTRLPIKKGQIDDKHVLLALSPSGQWSITGVDLMSPKWNYKNYMAHHLDVYRDILMKSPEICLV